MEALMMYLVEVNVLIVVFFLVYYGLFRNEKNFKFNRAFLLGTLFLALLIPLLPNIKGLDINNIKNNATAITPIVKLQHHIKIAETSLTTTVSVVKTQNVAAFSFPEFNYVQVIMGIYFLIVAVLLLRFIIQLLNVYMLIRANERKYIEGIVYCEHNKDLSPFSFFHHLFINKSKYDKDQIQQIIAHEKIHIKQWHSVDVLFSELVHVFLWINPFTISLKKYIKLNLEYIADNGVLNNGYDKKRYQLNILSSSLNFSAYPLTNLFGSSKIKRRIKMINSEKNSLNKYKYIAVIPLVLAAYFIVNIANFENVTTLQPFEGIYQLSTDKNKVFKVQVVNNALVAREVWGGGELHLVKRSELKFTSSDDGGFAVTFVKNNTGQVKEADVAKNKTSAIYLKLKAYKRDLKKEIQLSAGQLQVCAGNYQSEKNKAAFLQITGNGNNLILKQIWDGKEIQFYPTNELEFDSKSRPFPLKFTKDAGGRVISLLAFEKDVWNKVDRLPPVKKPVDIPQVQLKMLEGKYRFQKNKDAYLQISSTSNGLVLKQLWDGREIAFYPLSDVDYNAQNQPFPLKFIKDKAGAVTQLIAFDSDTWNKVN